MAAKSSVAASLASPPVTAAANVVPLRRAERRRVPGQLDRSGRASRPNLRAAVVDRDGVALDDAHSKADHIAVPPHFGPQRLPGKYRGGEAAGKSGEPGRVVAAHRFQHRMAGNAEIAEPVHDRPRVAGLPGYFRI